MTSYLVEADGGSRGNPGPAGYGAVVKDAADGQILVEDAAAIGTATNNVAEYRGLIAGLRALLDLAGDGAAAEVRMDSKLVVEQMAGRWKIKNEGLRPLASEAAALARRLRVTWKWIPRERNTDADRLANEAMDAAAKGLPWRSTASVTGGAPAIGGASGRGGTSAVGAARVSERPAASSSSGPAASAPAASPAAGRAGASAPAAQGSLFDATDVSEVPSGLPAKAAATAGTVTGTAPGTGWRPPTTAATTLILLRHGETPLSVERRFSGLGDPELTANGAAQAEAAAARLSQPPYGVQVIVSSPLRRARATAEAVAVRTGLEVVVEEDLREVDFGDWEGHTFTEIQRRWPDGLKAWLSDPAVAPPGGESFETAARRVEAVRDGLVERYEGRTVLVVSHVTPIKTLLRLALLAPPAALYRMHLDLACLSQVEYYADGPAVVKSFNDTSHLR
ncbi:bifunctional RNase H/acid phosphatase [Planomonospora parontospora]|uniref:bifunctional RNase H/acid phosphatase n=1 Tax=Planomonospora parontospora TaxID=58119 RepID=UPI001670EE3F|nr:bifunctional RNase H/acid phosphatase [Planomonospora parontospora]GGL27176.1 bifunctional RNase H/acid phosphatase [Planomonospora parontospora subsp. antibiotica]GII16556.1 bifunctional RNase H/acid phosphatase [Planomonospora parontospora subsp. antibiotica]